MFGILGAVDVGTGQTFPTFDDLFNDLKSRMQKEGYKVVKSRTHRNKVGGNYEKGSEVVRCDLVCDRGGQPYKCTATQLKTSTKKTDCPWKAKAVNRKTIGAWVLTVICDQHNHEARTPEPPTDEEDADADGDAELNEDQDDTGPAPDPSTAAALAVAGVPPSLMRLTGDTFHNFKAEYRKMAKPERISNLAQLQLRVAAIYAVENEDLQRQERQARQERKHQEIEENKRKTQAERQQRLAQIAREHMAVPPKHAFDETANEELVRLRERRERLAQIAREHLGTPSQQTPIPVPQFGMQSTPAGPTPIFRHYTGEPPMPNPPATPGLALAPPKRRGRPPKNANSNTIVNNSANSNNGA